MKADRAYIEAQECELRRWPGVKWERVKGGKHNLLRLTFGDQTRKVTFPVSSSDSQRGALNHLTDVKRTLRALGAEKVD